MSTSRTSVQMMVLIYYFPQEHARFEVAPVAEKPADSRHLVRCQAVSTKQFHHLSLQLLAHLFIPFRAAKRRSRKTNKTLPRRRRKPRTLGSFPICSRSLPSHSVDRRFRSGLSISVHSRPRSLLLLGSFPICSRSLPSHSVDRRFRSGLSISVHSRPRSLLLLGSFPICSRSLPSHSVDRRFRSGLSISVHSRPRSLLCSVPSDLVSLPPPFTFRRPHSRPRTLLFFSHLTASEDRSGPSKS
ncbi:GRAS domain-containing protein [Psidium guajava]|nr:GRAS domain-containing protein [Psidium guajava]